MDLFPRLNDIFHILLVNLTTDKHIIRLIKAPESAELSKQDYDRLNQFKT